MTKNQTNNGNGATSSKRSDAEIGLIALRVSLAKMHAGGVRIEFVNDDATGTLMVKLHGYRVAMNDDGKARIDERVTA